MASVADRTLRVVEGRTGLKPTRIIPTQIYNKITRYILDYFYRVNVTRLWLKLGLSGGGDSRQSLGPLLTKD